MPGEGAGNSAPARAACCQPCACSGRTGSSCRGSTGGAPYMDWWRGSRGLCLRRGDLLRVACGGGTLFEPRAPSALGPRCVVVSVRGVLYCSCGGWTICPWCGPRSAWSWGCDAEGVERMGEARSALLEGRLGEEGGRKPALPPRDVWAVRARSACPLFVPSPADIAFAFALRSVATSVAQPQWVVGSSARNVRARPRESQRVSSTLCSPTCASRGRAGASPLGRSPLRSPQPWLR